jgi:FkbM family methyltransferase
VAQRTKEDWDVLVKSLIGGSINKMLLRDIVPGLESTRIFASLRHTYLRLFKHDYWQQHVVGFRQFYSQFVKPGSLVFDCGANIGEYARAFLYLGATVIAVEPHPGLVAKLRRMRSERLTVVPCAIGQQTGELPLHISNISEISSLSSDWLDVVAQNDGWDGKPRRIDSVITVKVTTLDALADQFGMPDFIKIDVEGFELEALRGLTKVPLYLSFEFNSARIESAVACIQWFPNKVRFNYVVGEPSASVKLALPEWVTAERMCEIARNDLVQCRTFGDIFVRASQ